VDDDVVLWLNRGELRVGGNTGDKRGGDGDGDGHEGEEEEEEEEERKPRTRGGAKNQQVNKQDSKGKRRVTRGAVAKQSRMVVSTHTHTHTHTHIHTYTHTHTHTHI
jgi:hypothetical protein